MEHLPVGDIILQHVTAHIGYTHSQVAGWKITGYRFEDEPQYGSCGCSNWNSRSRSLKIDYEVTTKRGAVRKGVTSLSSEDVEELVEQAVRSIVPE